MGVMLDTAAMGRIIQDRLMTQTELARLAGVSSGTVNALLRGRTPRASIQTVKKFAEALKIDRRSLIKGV